MAPRDSVTLRDESTYMVLYRTGVGDRSDLASVTCGVQGQSLPIRYAGAHGELPGLDQVDSLQPPTVAGTVNVSLTANGAPTSTVTLLFVNGPGWVGRSPSTFANGVK
jgi:uncharacterized protein (TIGR03437 family)